MTIRHATLGLWEDLARAALATVAGHHSLDTRRAEFLTGLGAVAS